MLTGEYFHSLDSKGRVFVPAKLREALGNTFMLARSVDGCLSLYHLDEWTKLTDKLAALPDTQTRPIRRFLFTFASEATPDSQGRINIPVGLREYACLEREVAILGVGDHAEIWAADRWEEMKCGEDAANVEKMMRELGL
ncbi:MAG: division/cell wall cluster transcriptional repressor MraZ [Clostridiales bacterium]|nr:division/cell wall cluster transcriptional repressor MraZ [Clostridiales bacterium]